MILPERSTSLVLLRTLAGLLTNCYELIVACLHVICIVQFFCSYIFVLYNLYSACECIVQYCVGVMLLRL